MTAVKAWAIKGPDGRLLEKSICDCEVNAWYTLPRRYSVAERQREGYTAVEVTVIEGAPVDLDALEREVVQSFTFASVRETISAIFAKHREGK